MCEELYKTSLICFDSYENHILTGRIFNAYLESEVSFQSTMGFIKAMNGLLQELQFPQPSSASRVFHPTAEQKYQAAPLTSPAAHKGQLATFTLRIMFRQNSSWQGSLSWLEGRREESFRSVLELLLLIDSALSKAVA